MKADDLYGSFGANERALIDKISKPSFRHLAIHIMAVKMHLQFTGWLQYLILLPLCLVLSVPAGVTYLLGFHTAAVALFLFPVVILTIMLFDIITCRFRIRLPESLPKSGRSDSDVFKLMTSRHSCRSYQTRTLIPKHREAMQASVTKHLEQPHLGPIRLEWIDADITVWPIVNARQFLVAIAPAQYNRMAILDIGRTLQKVVIDAEQMGVNTCWIGPGADHNSVKANLGKRFDESRDAIICLCAVGYKSWYKPLFIRIFNSQSHKRLPLSELFFADDQMQQPLQIDKPPWSAYGQIFESCRWSPSSYNGQTTRCVVRQTGDVQQIDFYSTTSSRYYAPVAAGIWCGDWEMGCKALGIQGEFWQLNADKQDQSPPYYNISWIRNTETG